MIAFYKGLQVTFKDTNFKLVYEDYSTVHPAMKFQ